MSQAKQGLLQYQKQQEREIFKDCDYVVSFVGQERKRSILFGVFKVGKVEFRNNLYYYDLKEVEGFEDLIDRAVVDWGSNAISWHQWYDRQPKAIVEILPAGYMGSFPGLLDFVLEFNELKKLVDNPEAMALKNKQIEEIAVKDLKPYAQNARTHSEAQLWWQLFQPRRPL